MFKAVIAASHPEFSTMRQQVCLTLNIKHIKIYLLSLGSFGIILSVNYAMFNFFLKLNKTYPFYLVSRAGFGDDKMYAYLTST